MSKKTGPKVPGGLAVEKRTVTLDELTIRRLNVLGDGNVSQGIREAARVAYDRWQRTAAATPSREERKAAL